MGQEQGLELLSSANENDSQRWSVLLFYHVSPIEVPLEVPWHTERCTSLGLTGRLRVAPAGLNGTLSGETQSLCAYARAVEDRYQLMRSPIQLGCVGGGALGASEGGSDGGRSAPAPAPSAGKNPGSNLSPHPPTRGRRSRIDWKLDPIEEASQLFDSLRVRPVAELVTLGVPAARAPLDEAGEHISPLEFQRLCTSGLTNVGVQVAQSPPSPWRRTTRSEPQDPRRSSGEEHCRRPDCGSGGGAGSAAAGGGSSADVWTEGAGTASDAAVGLAQASGEGPRDARLPPGIGPDGDAACCRGLSVPGRPSKPARLPPVLLDVRNAYEWRLGRFELPADSGVHTLLPEIRQFSELPGWLAPRLNMLRGRDVVLYCTGGVRCEAASALVHTMLREKEEEEGGHRGGDGAGRFGPRDVADGTARVDSCGGTDALLAAANGDSAGVAGRCALPGLPARPSAAADDTTPTARAGPAAGMGAGSSAEQPSRRTPGGGRIMQLEGGIVRYLELFGGGSLASLPRNADADGMCGERAGGAESGSLAAAAGARGSPGGSPHSDPLSSPCLFRGQNLVFDARGRTGAAEDEEGGGATDGGGGKGNRCLAGCAPDGTPLPPLAACFGCGSSPVDYSTGVRCLLCRVRLLACTGRCSARPYTCDLCEEQRSGRQIKGAAV